MSVGKSFAKYEEQFKNVSRFNEPTINTIMTMVVRIKQPMTIVKVDGQEYDIVWNNAYSEPEIIEPGTTRIDHRGIVAITEWLKKVEAKTFYANTRHYAQPND